MALVTLTGAYSLNGNGRLNVGGAITTDSQTGVTTYTTPSANGGELGGFKSGSISFEASTVDNSTRGEGGWAVNSPGARNCTIELTWNKLENDDAQNELYTMLMQAQADWSTKGIAIAYLSSNGTDKSGFTGIFVPTAYSETQTGGGDADATAVECTMSFANYKEIALIDGITEHA